MRAVQTPTEWQGIASTSGLICASTALLCMVAARAGAKSQRAARGRAECRVVAVSCLNRHAPTLLGEPAKEQTPQPASDLLGTISSTSWMRSATFATVSMQFTQPMLSESSKVVEVSGASLSAAFGRTSPRRCLAARRIGAARRACGRTCRRGSTARAAHRRCGALLQRPFEVPEVVPPSYDASDVRTQIQCGLRSVSWPHTHFGRDVSSAMLGSSMGNTSGTFLAAGHISSLQTGRLETGTSIAHAVGRMP